MISQQPVTDNETFGIFLLLCLELNPFETTTCGVFLFYYNFNISRSVPYRAPGPCLFLTTDDVFVDDNQVTSLNKVKNLSRKCLY